MTNLDNESSVEVDSIDLPKATTNDTIENSKPTANEKQADTEEELFFWFEPGVCG